MCWKIILRKIMICKHFLRRKSCFQQIVIEFALFKYPPFSVAFSRNSHTRTHTHIHTEAASFALTRVPHPRFDRTALTLTSFNKKIQRLMVAAAASLRWAITLIVRQRPNGSHHHRQPPALRPAAHTCRVVGTRRIALPPSLKGQVLVIVVVVVVLVVMRERLEVVVFPASLVVVVAVVVR